MLSENFAFFLDGRGRYARIKGFEGTEKGMEAGSTWQDKGTLFYLEGSDYPVLFIKEEMPTGYRVAREANIDFNGFSLLAGIKLRL